MKIPFLQPKKKSSSQLPKEGIVSDMRASAFFLHAPKKEKGRLFDEVLKEVNHEQKTIVEQFGL